MLLSKAVRAATLAVAGAFLLTSLPALAAPVLPSLKPATLERSAATEVAATTSDQKKKKKPAKKVSGKKKPTGKKKPAKTA